MGVCLSEKSQSGKQTCVMSLICFSEKHETELLSGKSKVLECYNCNIMELK